MSLDDTRRERTGKMAEGLAASASTPRELARWHALAVDVVESMREEFGAVGMTDDQMAWVAFATTQVYAMVGRLPITHASDAIDRTMAAYGLAAGVLAGTYRLPPELGIGKPGRDGAEAPSSPPVTPEPSNPNIGQYL